MINFVKSESKLLLRYEPDIFRDPIWILRELLSHDTVTIRRIFKFRREHLTFPNIDFDSVSGESKLPKVEYYEFEIGKIINDYYRIYSDVIGIDFALFFNRKIDINHKCFMSHRDISIWPKLDKLNPPPEVYIGGKHDDAISIELFHKLLKKFPNSTETNRYVSSRISSILRDDLELEVDAESLYEKYMDKKSKISPDEDIVKLCEYEVSKFSLMRDKIADMLDADDSEYSENQWQHQILGILRMLFPKYIHVFREAAVIDKIVNARRSVDFLLVDYYGNIDIAEIKKPKGKNIVSSTLYRDNHIPLRELSGTIMQVEKYIYHLSRSAERGERKLMRQFKRDLPRNFEIKITNPKGIIIMGRDRDLDRDQLRDFEIIKRKYNNVIDIITYDDLKRRIMYSIEQFNKPIV